MYERHGATRTPTWAIWVAMRSRCSGNDPRYGGRGIAVCERWRHSFSLFLEDMGPRPSLEHSLDRYPDKNGDYEPGNCRWATASEQNRNKCSNIWITIDGEMKTAKDWASERGLNYYTLMKRIYHGWDPVDAVLKPLRGVG